jgi:hypothetical protein
LIADKTIITFSGNLYWERKEEEDKIKKNRNW